MKNKFSLLYRVQMIALLSGNGKKNKKKKVMTAGKLFLIWILTAAIVTFYEFIYINLFHVSEMLSFFPPFIILITSFFTLSTTMVYMKTAIFASTDHDLLLCLPISGRTVVASKLLAVYTVDFFLNLAILLPCGILYAAFAAPPVYFYPIYFTSMFFIPMIPTMLGALLALLFGVLAARFRYANAVGVILNIAFFAFFMGGILFTSFDAESDMTNFFVTIVNGVSRVYFPLTWFTSAVAGSFSNYLLLLGSSIVAFALTSAGIGAYYEKLREMQKSKTFKAAYKKAEKTSSAIGALMKKDWKNYCSASGVLLNTVMGVLVTVLLTVGMAFKLSGQAEPLPQQMMILLFPLALSFAAAMNTDTYSAVTLEGKQFAIIKFLPIGANVYLKSKLYLHLLFTVPVTVVCGIVLSVVGHFPLYIGVATVCTPLFFAYISGILGMLINLKKYKFDWTNPVMAVKNSFPVFISILFAFFAPLAVGAVGIGVMALGVSPLVLSVVLLVFLAVCSVLLTFLYFRKGKLLFDKIEL